MNITVKAPTPLHDHWGLEIRSDTPIEDCPFLTGRIIRMAKDLKWEPFHQGGSHGWDRCSGWHYIEFWNLNGDHDYRAQIQEFIDSLEVGL